MAGINAQRSAITAARKMIDQPEGQAKADLMVRMLRRTLVWLQTTPPEAVANQAKAGTPEEREEITLLLRQHPGIYSTDARFDARQVDATDQFLQASLGNVKLVPAASVVDARWAGYKR